MLDTNKDWLPLGSVVSIKGGDRLVMVIGFMAIDGNTKAVWDYVCCPYPEGKRSAEDLFINRESVDEVFQLGLRDAEGLAFEEYLESLEEDLKNQAK